jgi:hypothetical protein
MFEKGTNPSMDTITKIINAFPLLNLEWLVKGEGNIEYEIQNNTGLLKSLLKYIQKEFLFYDIDFTAGFYLLRIMLNLLPDSYISHPFLKDVVM